MDDKRLETIWKGFTHTPLGLGEMEALRFVRDESAKLPTREQIVAEIMKLIPPQMVPMERPSIEELEKILQSDERPDIHIAPDGSITTEKPHTVGDIADAIMRLLQPQTTEI